MNQAGFASMLPSPRRWDFLSGIMLENGYKTFVEVGCKEGRTTGHILKTVPDSQVIAIDPWRAMPQQKGVAKGETYEDWDFTKIEQEFLQNVGEHKDRCLMVRDTSEGASCCFMEHSLPHFEDPSADIVFIDAAHDEQSVRDDIKRWWPFVRQGGMLCGHDFNHKWPGVERAVAECFDLMKVGVGPDSVWFVIKGREDQLND